jgi:hypothetical protein
LPGRHGAFAFDYRREIPSAWRCARIKKSREQYVAAISTPKAPWDLGEAWLAYAIDFAERSMLFWDTLRKRGNSFIEHQRAGKPPVLHFDYEILVDARKFERPVNYALLKILPPAGVNIDPKRRPYTIIDPRAGHGPGIGGFRDDSEIGIALRDGHPVYFVMFFPEPIPCQTLMDVCSAEEEFVRAISRVFFSPRLWRRSSDWKISTIRA